MKDFDEIKNDYPTITDLMKEQNVSNKYNDYWRMECELNPTNESFLKYED